jgi:bifunctional non-homologous end joining protein LigD
VTKRAKKTKVRAKGAPRRELPEETTKAARTAPKAKAGKGTTRDLAAIKGASAAPMPEEVAPELATLVEQAPQGPGWAYELKYDGYRVLTFLEGGAVRFVTRSGQDWTDALVALEDAARAIPVKSAILDGEVVVMGPDGTTDFQALQNALREGKKAKLAYYAFDLLYLDGFDIRGASLADRKTLLAAILNDAPAAVRYSDHLQGDGSEVYQKACSMALEGLVAKRLGAPYRGGRSRDWLKLKCGCRQEFVIGGYTEPSGSRTSLGAILVGVYGENGELVFSGKVGTGFSTSSLREIGKGLKAIETSKSPFVNPPRMKGVHWVEPKLVAEVAFTAWTNGGNLRHPSFQGLREDKPARQIVREASKPTVKGALAAAAPSEPAKQAAKKVAPARATTNTDTDTAKNTNINKNTKDSVAALAPAPAKAPAARGGRAAGDLTVAGIRVSSPDKVLYPEQSITKRDLALYYEQIAEHMLPHVANRPLTLVRCPEGRGKPCFFQKHTSKGRPEAMKTIDVVERDGPDTYLYIDSVQGLISLVQMGALEIHVWGSQIDMIEQPDRLVIDLDPAPELTWEAVVAGAKEVREKLRDLGLVSFVKTTGGKGLHVVAPITRGRADWEEVKAFTRAIAVSMAGESPTRYTATITKAKRTNKIFIDYLRNGRGATAITTFSARARPGAPVSTPISWEELDTPLRPTDFTIMTVPRFLAERKRDPWEELASVKQFITDEMKRKVGLIR